MIVTLGIKKKSSNFSLLLNDDTTYKRRWVRLRLQTDAQMAEPIRSRGDSPVLFPLTARFPLLSLSRPAQLKAAAFKHFSFPLVCRWRWDWSCIFVCLLSQLVPYYTLFLYSHIHTYKNIYIFVYILMVHIYLYVCIYSLLCIYIYLYNRVNFIYVYVDNVSVWYLTS